ncbi:MAG TPA: hypothetical protein VN738_11345 [Acidothermaceae bacterium]|nr:hypothetical protein [Acidothermaceae bacterium]
MLRESVSRRDVQSDVSAALTTQVMTSVAIALQAGDVVSKLAFMSGATAAGTPTNWWFALYDNSATPALLGQTADQLTAAWAADTVKDLALAAPVTITTTGLYYAACMVKATTVPSLACAVLGRAAVAGAVLTGQKVLAQTSGSGLTTTAPATIATPTTVANLAYAVAH